MKVKFSSVGANSINNILLCNLELNDDEGYNFHCTRSGELRYLSIHPWFIEENKAHVSCTTKLVISNSP